MLNSEKPLNYGNAKLIDEVELLPTKICLLKYENTFIIIQFNNHILIFRKLKRVILDSIYKFYIFVYGKQKNNLVRGVFMQRIGIRFKILLFEKLFGKRIKI